MTVSTHEFPRWNLFDANCVLGRGLKTSPGNPHRVSDLLVCLDAFDISEALVVDTLSRENHPADGNRRILEATAGEPRLHPAWAALPPGTDDE